MKKRKKPDRRARPANEITEDEVAAFLEAIRNFNGYPKVRDLGKMFPHHSPFKINVILRYLERSKLIVIDSESYITWVRKDGGGPDQLTIADVADISDELKEYLSGKEEKEEEE
ncbi:MAG: hypothetical protein ABI347_03030 [Nitrososphaera sp.]